MRVNRGWLVLLCLPFITGLRDPFQPPGSRCPAANLSQWRYMGYVGGAVPLGIVTDSSARWQRVRKGERLPVGWRVAALNEKELILDTAEACEPQSWRWQREGTKKDENMDSRAAADRQPGAGR